MSGTRSAALPYRLLTHLSIKNKLQLLVLLFIVVVSGLVSYTVISLDKQKDDGLVVNIAGRQRMLTQKLTKEFLLAVELAKGDSSKFQLGVTDGSKKLFEVSLNALLNGGTTYLDPAMTNAVQLPPAKPEVAAQLQRVQRLWQQHIQSIQRFDAANYKPEELSKISGFSVQVLTEMNKAVVMLANASDANISTMKRNQIIGSLAALLVALLLATLIARSITLPLAGVVDNTKRIANGDLKKYLDDEHLQNELGLLTSNVEDMRAALHDVINVVQRNSRQMAHSAQQVSEVSSEISATSQLEQQGSEQVLQAVYSLLQTSDQVSEQIASSAQVAQHAGEHAKRGIEVVNQGISELNGAVGNVNDTATQMHELKAFTEQINEITESIHNIAEQTNLLALNAAIEAARAGDQGRGFAVVADEVRNLAARTSSSSSEISELLGQLTSKVECSVDSMETVVSAVHSSQEKSAQTVESFNAMSVAIKQTSDGATVIADINGKQAENLAYLDSKLKDLFEVLRESSGKAGTTSMVAGDLYQISEQLEEQLKGFDTEFSDSVEAAGKEQRQYPRVENKVRVVLRQGRRMLDGLSRDISLQGLKIRAKDELDVKQAVSVELAMPTELAAQLGATLVLSANIVHKDHDQDLTNYGLRFSNVAGDDLDKLKQLFTHFQQPYQYA